MTTKTENEKAVESTIRHSFISMGLDKEKSCGEIISELRRENEQLKETIRIVEGARSIANSERDEVKSENEQLKDEVRHKDDALKAKGYDGQGFECPYCYKVFSEYWAMIRHTQHGGCNHRMENIILKEQLAKEKQRFEQLKKKIKENIEFAKKHHEKSMWDKGAISGLQLCLDIMNDKETCEDNANRKLLEQVKK